VINCFRPNLKTHCTHKVLFFTVHAVLVVTILTAHATRYIQVDTLHIPKHKLVFNHHKKVLNRLFKKSQDKVLYICGKQNAKMM